MQKVVNTNK